MKTNFFTELEKLVGTGNGVTIGIKNNFGKLTVSVVNTIVTGDKNKVLAPVVLTGNVGELDEGFFGAILPIQEKVKGLAIDLSATEKEIEAITEENKKKLESKKTGKKKDDDHNEVLPDEKPIKEKKVPVSDLLKQATDLMTAIRHAEAIPLLEQALAQKPDNKSAQQKLDVCKKWIARSSEAKESEKAVTTPEIASLPNPQVRMEDMVPAEEQPIFDDEPVFDDEPAFSPEVIEEAKQSEQPSTEEDFELF